MWFYMTPQSPKPSMHEVATGFWKPNTKDGKADIDFGFGATINIINGGLECGKN
jgi:chitinase